jgi:hypothetical protein
VDETVLALWVALATALGAIAASIVSVVAATRGARREREARTMMWVRAQKRDAYAHYIRAFYVLMLHSRRRMGPSRVVLQDWQNAYSVLELIGSAPIRLQADRVWDHSVELFRARRLGRPTEALDEGLKDEMDVLLNLMQEELGFVSHAGKARGFRIPSGRLDGREPSGGEG